MDHMAQAAADHIDREHFSVFWESLQVSYISFLFSVYCNLFFSACVSWWPVSAVQLAVEEVLGFAEANGQEEAEQAAEHLERLLFILHTLVSHRNGAKVTKPEAVCQVISGHEYLLVAMSFHFYSSRPFVPTDGSAADSELVPVGPLLPPPPPDNLLAAPRGEHCVA